MLVHLASFEQINSQRPAFVGAHLVDAAPAAFYGTASARSRACADRNRAAAHRRLRPVAQQFVDWLLTESPVVDQGLTDL